MARCAICFAADAGYLVPTLVAAGQARRWSDPRLADVLVLGIGLVALVGWQWLDSAVAIGVAINILREGASLMWKSSQGLMDKALEPEVMDEVHKTLASFEHHTIRFDHISSRRSGRRRFVDMHMHMPAGWTLGRAAALRTSVEQALMSAVPGLRATIQLLPSDVEAHFDDHKDLI